ncbi:MAG: MBL fold metallo-hydrolase [Hyphomonadaceae bacterium]|nr:MBL fold metallo-hydrolase [Hyphomonadaceae bacterium]
MLAFRLVSVALLTAGCTHARDVPDTAEHRSLFQHWIDGTDASEPQTQTQRYDTDTFVIRQSVRTNPEAPFLYLLFGKDRALLLDTGAGGLMIRPAVDAAINQWLVEHKRTAIPLVVAHSHGHGDHQAGDAEFRDRPDTKVVGLQPAEISGFFGIADWPNSIARFDLGDRVLHVIPTPGHHPAHIMIYDERAHLLLSGDSLYPGRIYIPANLLADFQASMDRLAGFLENRTVSHVLGAHIEMTRKPGVDFKPNAPQHPDEHILELPVSDVAELRAAVRAMGDKVVREVHDDFIVFPLPPRLPPAPASN